MLGVDIVFIVSFSSFVARAIFATAARTIFLDIYGLFAVQKRPGTVVHAISEEIFVDVGVELRSLVVIVWRHWLTDSTRAVVHHGHPSADRTAHGIHATHIDVVHRRG